MDSNSPSFIPSTEWQDIPDSVEALPPHGEYRTDFQTNKRQARWDNPPGPETVIYKKAGASANGETPKDSRPLNPPLSEKDRRQSGAPRQKATPAKQPYQPRGNSPAVYCNTPIQEADILIGNGFLERASAIIIVGSSGIGKSSIGMQMGCLWSCGQPAFDLDAPRQLRIIMMQHEDSRNDVIRMSQLIKWCGVDPATVEKNFWIETVRGYTGKEAVNVMRDLVKWWKADLLILNPLSAYHDGDISRNEHNMKFLYGELGTLLSELDIGLVALHHDIKPLRGGNAKAEENYHDIKYNALGGSVLTNFFRGIITVMPIGDTPIFRFTLAKRFEESGWSSKVQSFKWHEDRSKRIWVPASIIDVDTAQECIGKDLHDLRKLVPVTGTIDVKVLENEMSKAGFKQREQRALVAEACADTTPDNLRLYKWYIYNPNGQPHAAISRFEQPYSETPAAIREAKEKEKSERKRASKNQ